MWEIRPVLRRSRNKSEFLDLLEPLRHQLYGYACRAVNRSDAVPDVLQDVTLTAWREFPRFMPGTNFRAWVFRIMVNTIFNHNKRIARERLIASSDMPLDIEAVLEHENEWAAILEDPGKLREVLDDRIVHALDSLGKKERQCFLLCLLQGLSYKEIGEVLDLPLGTVMSHVHRARVKLRERLTELAIERRLIAEVRP